MAGRSKLRWTDAHTQSRRSGEAPEVDDEKASEEEARLVRMRPAMEAGAVRELSGRSVCPSDQAL